MKYAIEPELIYTQDAKILEEVFWGINPPNEFTVNTEEQFEAWLECTWIDNTNNYLGSLIKNELTNWLQGSYKPELKVCSINISGNELSYKPEDARIFLNQQFQVYVENSSTDGEFLNALIKLFPKHSKQIIRFQKKLMFGILLGGGGTLIDALKTKMTELGRITDTPNKFIRFFVLVDSDKKISTDKYKAELIALIDFCATNSIPFHVFEKREMDNYLPDELIEKLSVACSTHFLDNYRKLSETEKDFLDLETESNWDSKIIKTNFKRFIAELW